MEIESSFARKGKQRVIGIVHELFLSFEDLGRYGFLNINKLEYPEYACGYENKISVLVVLDADENIIFVKIGECSCSKLLYFTNVVEQQSLHIPDGFHFITKPPLHANSKYIKQVPESFKRDAKGVKKTTEWKDFSTIFMERFPMFSKNLKFGSEKNFLIVLFALKLYNYLKAAEKEEN